jgi:hypothetical protein
VWRHLVTISAINLNFNGQFHMKSSFSSKLLSAAISL